MSEGKRRGTNQYTVHRVDRELLILAALSGRADPSTIRISREMGVHPNTVRRWFRGHEGDEGYDRLAAHLEKAAKEEERG